MESQLKIINEDFMKTNSLNQISNNNIETINNLNKLVFSDFNKINQINSNVQQQQMMDGVNNNTYYDRVINKQKLYDLPHQNLFTSFMENSEEIYEPDYDFMNMINNQSLPWKAKIHPHFLNKTNQHMMNLIGWSKFKQIKQSQHIQK